MSHVRTRAQSQALQAAMPAALSGPLIGTQILADFDRDSDCAATTRVLRLRLSP